MDSGKGANVPHILLLEDDKAHRDLALRGFQDDPDTFRVSVAGTIREAREIIGRDPPDLIIADWLLPDGKGIEILTRRDGIVAVPLVVMTSHGNERLAVEIMKSGAIDYVVKSATAFRELPHTARRALRDWENIRQRQRVEQERRDTEKRLADIIGFLPDAVLAIDDDRRVIAWNKAMEAMTGVPAADMLGKGDYEYSLPLYGERRPILIDLVLKDDEEIRKKYLSVQRDGEKLISESFVPAVFGRRGAHVWTAASPLYDTAGNRVGAIETIRDITDRKQAEESLRQQNTILEMLLNAPLDVLALLDRRGIIISLNREGIRQYGSPGQTPIGRCVYDHIPPELATARKKFIDRVFETGEPVRFDDENAGKHLDNAIYPIFNADRTAVEYVAVYAIDSTERKRAEQALQMSEERFRHISGLITDFTFSCRQSPGGVFSLNWITGPVEQITGYTAEELFAMRCWRNIVLENDLEIFDERVVGLQPGMSSRCELRIRRKDGTIRWLACYGECILDPLHPSRLVLYGGCQDITDNKQAEEALRESEERYLSLFNRSLDCIYIHDLEGHFLDMNVSALDLLGYSREEIPRLSFQTLLSPDQLGKAKAAVETIVRDGSHSGLIEFQLKRKDGGFVDIETKGTLIVRDGKPYAVVGIARDITNQKQAEGIRRAYEARLNSAMEIGSLAWWEMDLPDGAVRFDDRMATMLGYSPEKFRHYTDFTALLHPDDYEPAMQAMRDHLEGRDPRYHTDYRILTAAGDYRWLRDVGGITVRRPDGSPATVTGIVIDITASKQVENALRRSEELLRQTQQLTRIGGWEYDVVAEKIRWTDEVYRIYGVSPDYDPNDISRSIKFYAPEDQAILETAFRRAVEDGQSYDLELRFISADKKQKWVRTTAVVDRVEEKTVRVYGNIMDITDRKASEETLRQSETRFRALIQNSSDIIRILDRNGRIVYESDSSERILGHPPGFLIGGSPLDYIHPDDRERVKKDFQEVVAGTNSGTPTEFRVRKADGEYLWVDSIGVNLLDTPGVNGIVITTRPIQQRKEAEQALNESEERLRLALEGADIASWDLDLASGKAVFSDRFYTMLGYKSGEFPATYDGWAALMHPDDRDRVLQDLQRQIEEKRQLCEIEYRLLSKDGDWIWILGRGKIAGTDNRGNPARLTGVNIDITSRRLMESEIQSLNTVLEQRVKDRTEALSKANEALEEENAQRVEAESRLKAAYDEKVMLIKEIHHRVKNNLQIIISLLNLQSRYIKDEATLAAIRESQNRVRAMSLVHEKLYQAENVSKIQIQDYIRFLGNGLFQFYGAKSRGVRLTLDVGDVDATINTAIPLGLIVNELISNSLKYAFPDGRTGEITITVRKEDHGIHIGFGDNGVGIPETLDWKDTKSLGLRLVNTLVDQLNGTIELDRHDGTHFSMVLYEKE